MPEVSAFPTAATLTGAEEAALVQSGGGVKQTVLNIVRQVLALVQNFTVGGNLTVNGSTQLGDGAGDVLTIPGTSVVAANGLNFTGATVSFAQAVALNGGVTLGDAAGDALTINSSTVTVPAAGINLNNGNVGVGKTPAAKFDVNGSVRVAVGSNIEWGDPQYSIAVSGTTMKFYTANIERMSLNGSGLFWVGATSGTYHQIQRTGAGLSILGIVGSQVGWQEGTTFNSADAGGYSTQNAPQWVGRNATTGRSINAGGTLNASGADYAEYVRKHALCGTILKGQICGIDGNRQLVMTFADMVRPALKSVDPSYVGGDRWGTSGLIGERPTEPAYVAPSMPELPPHPGEVPPFADVELTPPTPAQGAEPAEPVQQEGEDLLAFARRVTAWVSAHAQWVQLGVLDAEAARAFDAARKAQTIRRKAHRAAEAALAEWEAAVAPIMEAHAEAVRQAEVAHAAAMAQYKIDLTAFEAKLEEARQHYDRVTWSGQVPATVSGPVTAGDYVIAEDDGAGGIIGVCVAEPTSAQLKRKVGFVMVANPTPAQLLELIDERFVNDPDRPNWNAIVDVGRG